MLVFALLPQSNDYYRRYALGKVLYLENDATGEKWVKEFSENIRSALVLIVEGKENSYELSRKIKLHSARAYRMKVYKRRNLINGSSCKSLLNKISVELEKGKGLMQDKKNQTVCLMLTSTSVFEKVGNLVEILKDQGEFRIIAHHDRIIDRLKKIHGSIRCIRVNSLSPKVISEELNSLL